MRKIAKIFLLIVIIFIAFLYLPIIQEKFATSYVSISSAATNVSVNEEETVGLQALIGQRSDEIMRRFGMPSRRYPSEHGFEWWVYHQGDEASTYFQVGIKNDIIVTFHVIGEEVAIAPFQIGKTYGEIMQTFPFLDEIAFSYRGNDYLFELTERNLLQTPLVPLDNDLWVQLYFDTFTTELSSVRFMDTETLLTIRPFQLTSTGELPTQPVLSAELMREIELGEAQTIFDITNIMRTRFGLNPLEWNEQAAIVALSHSQDMNENLDFSINGNMKERMIQSGVTGTFFDENIVSYRQDAIVAVEGLMNSKGDRENILSDDFISIGVGVYNQHTAQIFVH